MKKQNKPHFVIMATIMAVFAALTWSCNKDDDPSLADLREDKLQYLEDSLRISDSLKRFNAAGVVNYAIIVINGSTSSLNNDGEVGRSEKTQTVVTGATVTISQFGKTETDTTDASGMVVFNGFFRHAASVTVRAEGFTSASYIAAVSINDSTGNNSVNFVGNIIPIFETTGANTATITGRATIQTDLTNRTRELVPDGTTLTASINATDVWFSDQYLTENLENIYEPSCGCDIIYVGEILQAAYSTGVIGTVTGGDYTITVPAAIDELPLFLDYSDIAATQTLYETNGVLPGDRTATYRTIFSPFGGTSAIPAGSSVVVAFESFTTAAAADAVTSPTSGVIDHINIVGGGTGYAGVPLVEITDTGNGTGAVATATVVNGVVTAINLTNGGSGYVNPSATLIAGTGATADAATLAQDGTVTSVVVSNSGSGYTATPAVTFSAPTGTGLVTGVTATGTAVLANGRITGINITNAGAGYTAPPTVTIDVPTATGSTPATATAFYSGQSVQDVQVLASGQNYTFAPRVTFSAPDIATGRRATGTAIINTTTRQVTGITITDAGMGYTNPPTVTLSAFTTPATTQTFLAGGSVISADITDPGSGYTGIPTVTFTGGGGQGATGTAVVVDGKVVGITITNGGTGYTGIPDIEFTSGNGAVGFATVVDGAVTAITVTDPGRFYTAAPRVILTSTVGGGAAATAAVANGGLSAVTVDAGGSGYLEGNTPNSAEGFSTTVGTPFVYTRPGKTYIVDVHYGTGERQPN